MIEPGNRKTFKITYLPSENSGQPVLLRSVSKHLYRYTRIQASSCWLRRLFRLRGDVGWYEPSHTSFYRVRCAPAQVTDFRGEIPFCLETAIIVEHVNIYVKKKKNKINKMSPVKRICVFEHSVMTNFNCACPDIQMGQGSGFLSEGSSWFTASMSEQRRFWRDCADAQARLNFRCSHRL